MGNLLTSFYSHALSWFSNMSLSTSRTLTLESPRDGQAIIDRANNVLDESERWCFLEPPRFPSEDTPVYWGGVFAFAGETGAGGALLFTVRQPMDTGSKTPPEVVELCNFLGNFRSSLDKTQIGLHSPAILPCSVLTCTTTSSKLSNPDTPPRCYHLVVHLLCAGGMTTIRPVGFKNSNLITTTTSMTRNRESHWRSSIQEKCNFGCTDLEKPCTRPHVVQSTIPRTHKTEKRRLR